MEQKLQFPQGFLWGASTSSHQVEGHNQNDWTEWETSAKRLEHLKRSGKLDTYGLHNFISRDAANHYHLYKEDFQLAKDLAHNATRISLEWSRIEPEEGVFNVQALKKYAEIISDIRALGIEPFVTLWHWTLPRWLAHEGGWKNRDVIKYFVRYTEKVVEFFGDRVTFWITLNEPEIYTTNSYLTGVWPPQERNPFSAWRVLGHFISAHNKAFRAIKKQNSRLQVGVATNNVYFEAHKNHAVNQLFRKLYDWFWNLYFLNRIKNHQDFIGLNYYFRSKIDWGRIRNDNAVTSDIGWELYPEGIYHVLKDLQKYKKPVYITENGLADATDKQRAWFIVEILRHVHRAIKDGVDVRGYLHWSLLDNFEWDKGFYPRFGLVEVDYNTQQRKARNSAKLYADIARKNALMKEHFEQGKLETKIVG